MEATKKESILITGVCGLIGSRMADWLLRNQSQYEVVGIDDLSGGYLEHLPAGVVFYQINCCDVC